MKREGVKTVVATVRDAEARMREKDKRTAEAVKRFTLGEPVEIPVLFHETAKRMNRKYQIGGARFVVTKVDRKRGKITLSSVVEVERCGATPGGRPIYALGRKL